jgi:hypothetical protein
MNAKAVGLFQDLQGFFVAPGELLREWVLKKKEDRSHTR